MQALGRHSGRQCQRPAPQVATTRHSAPAQRRPRTVQARAVEMGGSPVELLATLEHLQRWLDASTSSSSEASSSGRVAPSRIEPKRLKAAAGSSRGSPDRVGFVATGSIQQGSVLLELPEAVAVTSVDAEKHEVIGEVAKECSELVALTLWLMAERAKAGASAWAPLLATLPEATQSPILWDDQERKELLTGSPVLAAARERQSALQQQWRDLHAKWFSQDTSRYSPMTFNEANFLRSFCVVLAHAVFLPSAECFALLPIASLLGRTGNGNGCDLDYDAERSSVVVRASVPHKDGQEVLLNDGRPNGELLLSTGTLQEGNASDFLMFKGELIPADKYYTMKTQVLEQLEFGPAEQFPVYSDRFPIQLLAYLRLSRIQDPGQFAKVSFDKDIEISQMNEYEVLQLLMGDIRERLAEYKSSQEEDVKALQSPTLVGRPRLAARLRSSEMRILSGTMDAVRRRLAPIRGIPTKSGSMTDPNADIAEMFDFIEDLPRKPGKLLAGLARWASGADDPDWNK